MKTNHSHAITLFFLLLAYALAGCQSSSDNPYDENIQHSEEKENDRHSPKSHGGTLFTKEAFSLELQIYETGVPPHYRIYAYEDGKLISPHKLSAIVTLERLGGSVQHLSFSPLGDFLISDDQVREPHSFNIKINAEYKDRKYVWNHQSYEARTEIKPEVAKRSGIKTAVATSQKINKTLHIHGKIVPSEHRISHIIPRFAGMVREGKKTIGDRVEQGEVLAIIESNESLQPFEVRSQISGIVTNGHLAIGEFVPEGQWIYIVADISEVWADFSIPLRYRSAIQQGQSVSISLINGNKKTQGKVSYLSPYLDEKTQSQLARIIVSNTDGDILPGAFVMGETVIEESNAKVAIKKEALQGFRDWKVVFVKVGNIYEARPLTLGTHDDQWIEVLEGLSSGDEYVVKNSFLIKADILKSGASHDH